MQHSLSNCYLLQADVQHPVLSGTQMIHLVQEHVLLTMKVAVTLMRIALKDTSVVRQLVDIKSVSKFVAMKYR